MTDSAAKKEQQLEAVLNAPLLTIAYKALLTLISIAIAILFGLGISLLSVGNAQTFMEYYSSDGAVACLYISSISALIYALLAILYALFKRFGVSEASKSFCRVFGNIGIILPFISILAFTIINASIAAAGGVPAVFSVILSILIIFITFCPIAVTWRIYEEDRLKNFIDGISKTLACLGVLAGAIAVILH